MKKVGKGDGSITGPIKDLKDKEEEEVENDKEFEIQKEEKPKKNSR